MRKMLCVVPALLLFAMIGAPNAHADSYTATFTCTPPSSVCMAGPPLAQTVSFPTPTINVDYVGTGVLGDGPLEARLTLPTADPPTDSYTWFITGVLLVNPVTENGTIEDTIDITDGTNGQATSVLDVNPGFGGYVLGRDYGGSLTFSPTSAAAPEPTPILLMLLGIALIFFIRNRFVMTHGPRTT